MLTQLMLFLLFYSFFNVINGYDTVECSSEMLAVHSIDNLTYLQTPNYPQTLSNETFSASCYANFTANNPNVTIWFAMLNGNAGQMTFCEYLNVEDEYCILSDGFDSNGNYFFGSPIFARNSASHFIFEFDSDDSLQPWTALQAIIVLNKINSSSCPLSTNTFDFVQNPQLIIPATNFLERIEDYDLRGANCSWNFIINSEQQLKIVVKSVALFSTSTLILYNENVMIKNFTEKDVDYPLQVYYFDGTNFTMQFISQDNKPYARFFLQVTVVQKIFNYTAQGCHAVQQNGITTYTNIDYINGYPPYQQCINTLSIPSNHQAVLTLLEYNYEDCCDKFYIKDNHNSTYDLTTHETLYTLKAGSNNNQLIFNSDGNTQQSGYKVELNVFECKCGPSNYVIQCNGEKSVLSPLDNNNPYYCDNMNCNYQILTNASCPNTYLEIYSNSDNSYIRPSDYIVVKSNGKLLKNITASTYDEFWIFLSNGISLEFHSGNSPDNIISEAVNWQIIFKTSPSPTFSNIEISETNPNYVFWLTDTNSNEATVVCASTGTLIMYITNNTNVHLYNWLLYDGNDMNNLIGDLKSDSISSSSILIPRSIQSSSGCLTLYTKTKLVKTGTEQYTVLFQIYNENCQNTVFQSPYKEYNLQPVTFKTSSIKCNAIILSTVSGEEVVLPYVQIVSMNTTSENKTFTFKSLANDRELFQVQSSNSYQWQEMLLYTIALDIIIPPYSDFTIHFTAGSLILQHYKNVQRGIIASPSYSGFMKTFSWDLLYWINLFDWMSGSFVAKEWKGNPNFLLEVDGNNYTFGLNQNITFNHSYQIFARYQENNPAENEFLIEYVINDKYPSTTTSTTTTTTTPLITTLKPTSTSLSTTKATTATSSTSTTPKLTSHAILTSSSTIYQNTTTSSTSSVSIASTTTQTSTIPSVTYGNNIAFSNKLEIFQLILLVCFYSIFLKA